MDVVSLLLRHESMGMMARGHYLKLRKRECHSNIRQNFFSCRVVNMWNSLSEEVVIPESVNSFKGRFDRWYADSKYKLKPVTTGLQASCLNGSEDDGDDMMKLCDLPAT